MTNQTGVSVRPLQEGDVSGVVELFRRTWLDGLPKREGSLAAALVLEEYLSDHAWGLVAHSEDDLLGVIMAGLRETNQSERWAWLGEEARRQAEALEPGLLERLRADTAVEAEEARMTRALKATGIPEADATIQLLLLTPSARGHHLGSRFLDAARDWMRSEGARGYFLMTDDECDVGFYDHLGLHRMHAETVEAPAGTLGVYAYGEPL